MASGVPIVASDLPSVREVLNDTNSVLVSPDSPEALLEGIIGVLEDESRAGIMAEHALSLVRRFTWVERVKKILGAIEYLKI